MTTALAVTTEELDPDGWLRLEVTFQDTRHAEWALRQLATNAEVLAPESLRTTIHTRATTIATNYAPTS